MAATSNANQVLDDLHALVTSFGFRATSEGRSLGLDCAHIVAEGIAARSIDKQSGADGIWPDNKEPYKTWKGKKYHVYKPNVRTGQMLSIESLLGQTTVTTDQVQMLYGTGKPPSRSSASSYFDPKTDGDITDIEKAFYNSDTRPFYELDDEIVAAVFDRIEQCIAEYLRRGR